MGFRDGSCCNQNGRSPHCGWIVFHNDGASKTRQYIAYRYIIFSKFVIAMVRNADGATHDESLDLRECCAQLALK